jgi:gas vesicle protein
MLSLFGGTITMKWKLLLSGFIVGSVAAGISTLLAAPHSGKTTRSRLNQNKQIVRNQIDELKTNLQEITASAAAAVKEVKTQVPAFISGVKASVSHWEEDIHPQQLEIHRELAEIKATVQKREK